MLFNSLQYAVFLPIVVLAYYGLPQRLRWLFLLLSSYYFYMCWRPEYALLLVTSTVVDYWCGLKLEKTQATVARRLLLVASLLTNLGLLFAFKYFNFFSDTANALFGWIRIPLSIPELDVLLPIGISFYTFQTLSYTIDVYRRQRPAERHLGFFALYVSFFPQLVAGPIERSSHLLPQLQERRSWNPRCIENGLKLIAWGLFKKVVIADRLACFVDPVYADPHAFSGGTLLLATYFFAFQIYCDFSGYSDIAIGSAQLLGIDLRLNFRRPFLAANVQEFWTRWHISLSTWFRDYVYIPLGGSRVRRLQWVFNIMLVFLVSGLWHGANWTFVAWGGVHGVLLLLFYVWRSICRGVLGDRPTPLPSRLRTLGGVFLTFHAVLLSWIFFRAASIADCAYVLQEILLFKWVATFSLSDVLLAEFGKQQLLIAVTSIFALVVVELFGEDDLRRFPAISYRPVRWACYYALLLVTINFGMFHSPQQFIYFQF